MDWNMLWEPFVKYVLPILVAYGLTALAAYLTQLAKLVRDERVRKLIEAVVIGVEQAATAVEKETEKRPDGAVKFKAAYDTLKALGVTPHDILIEAAVGKMNATNGGEMTKRDVEKVLRDLLAETANAD